MTMTIEKLPDGPIIRATFHEPMDWHQDATDMLDRLIELRDATIEGCPKYYAIIDLSAVKVGISDIVIALAALRRIHIKRRPDMPASVLLVGTGNFMQLVTQAVGQQQYGEYQVKMYMTMATALDDIRADIAAWSRQPAG